MYHARFRGTHYEIGFKWGSMLLDREKYLLDDVPFPITEERLHFSTQCLPYYEKYYPEILEEIKGIAEGQKIPFDKLSAVLLSMYCIMPENKCSCFAYKNEKHIILARNSDFLTEIEKLYMNCIYHFSNGNYSFNGNTTAFVEIEDGVNEFGFAIGLTSVYPSVLGQGLNAGMLLRYGLEKCKNVNEFIAALEKLPIASSQTFTAADREGNIAVIECNSEKVAIRYPDETHNFVSAVNSFHLKEMEQYRCAGIDDWNAEERFETIQKAFQEADDTDIQFALDTLSGKYGFLCQYDRSTGKDTVWSVVYDLKQLTIQRCEGNPSRKRFKEDARMAFRENVESDIQN